MSSNTPPLVLEPRREDHKLVDGSQYLPPPINRLPPELLAAIFSFLVVDYEESLLLRATIPILLVCRYWRDAALGEPILWRTIYHTPPSLTSLLLQRSKEAPLRAAFVLDNHDVRDSAHRVMEHFNRVVEFSLIGMSDELDEILENLPEEVPFLESWNMTKKLNHELPPPSTHFYKVRAPRLRRFALRGFTCDWTSSLFSGLTSLGVFNAMRGTKTSPETILHILSASPQLTELSLRGVFDESNIHGISGTSIEVKLPRLKRLFLGETFPVAGVNQMMMLERLSFPATVNVVIYCRTMNVQDFHRLFKSLGNLTHGSTAIPMKRVDLTLTGHAIRFEGRRVSDTGEPHLYLSLQCSQPRGSLELARALCGGLSLAGVETLHIPGSILGEAEPATWTHLLRYFPNVQTFQMGFLPRAIAAVLGYTSEDGRTPAVLSRLHTFELGSGEHSFKDEMSLRVFMESLSTRCQIHCPLTRLKIDDVVPSEEPRYARLVDQLVSEFVRSTGPLTVTLEQGIGI
ncbi:hypothetical protein OE88DRAFT_659235 [Heliocybe sulcata]|uniref:F-box domain-containing protein n=1 Tax=Heliocybe sulcata TaxID=5364 RepID=A0A5C3NEI7_9AGAM|nr:hypothetical protein OE88DRAFT_659235 [Heliocybe sulcata]